MKMFKILFRLIYLMPLTLLFGQDQITCSVFSSLGGVQSNTDYSLYTTLGEAIIVTTSNSSNQLQAGFWNVYKQNVLTAVDNNGAITLEYKLYPNYPNPFNPSTTIHFELPKESHVTMKVYNMLGQEVLVVLDEEKVAGRYDVRIDGSNLSSGVYFYSLHVGAFTETKKLLLLK